MAGRRQLLGLLEPAGPDREHHLGGVYDEADREMIARGQRLPQLGEPASGVLVPVEQQVHRLPQQAHQQVAAPPGQGALPDQLLGQRPAERAVPGTEQAVVRQAQRAGPGLRVRGPGGLGQHRDDRLVAAVPVVGLADQPGPQPQADRGIRIDEVEHPPQPGQQYRAGRRAVLVHPQPAQAQQRAGHRLHVARALGQAVGQLVPAPAGPQVALDGLGVIPSGEQRIQLAQVRGHRI